MRTALLATTALLALGTTASAQMDVAAMFGPPARYLSETSVAASPDAMFVVVSRYKVTGQPGKARWVRYGHRSFQNGQWTPAFVEAPIPATWRSDSSFAIGWDLNSPFDPATAYDAGSGHFWVVVAAKIKETATGDERWAILVNSWDPQSGAWSGWFDLDSTPNEAPAFSPLDKPWIVAGEPNELYVFWLDLATSLYHYNRTTNSGQTWIGGVMTVPDPMNPGQEKELDGHWAMFPTTVPGAPVFCLRTTVALTYRFVYGIDDASTGGVNFFPVVDGSGAEIEMTVDGDGSEEVPFVPNQKLRSRFMPVIAIDPTGVREFYVAYYAFAPEGPLGNYDCWVRHVDWDSQNGNWVLGSQIRINTSDPPPPPEPGDPPDDHADQFLPALTVDCQGDVHVIYYNDRRFSQVDSTPNFTRFDVSYSVSHDSGQTWVKTTYAAPSGDSEWVDEQLMNSATVLDWAREYNDIAFACDSQGAVLSVWAAVTGTSVTDETAFKTVIWGFRVQ